MATWDWDGGAGDWTDATRWTAGGTGAQGAPEPGDSAAIASGDVDLVGAESLDGSIYDGVALSLGDGTADPARLDLTGADVGRFFSITARGSATIASTGASALGCPVTTAGAGTVLTLAGDPAQPNGLLLTRGGSVTIAQGTVLDLEGSITDEAGDLIAAAAGSTVVNAAAVKLIGSQITVEGDLTGTGTIAVDDASSLVLGGRCGPGQTISFGDIDGRLDLAALATFSGAVTGFKAGDLIDFTGVDAAAATYDATSETLTLTDAAGATVATLHDIKAAVGALTVTQDAGDAGTTVGYAGALPRKKYQIADGDRAMRSDVVRGTMTVPGTQTPITGAGVKVGIISTSFDEDGLANQDAAAGYLPANPDGTSAVQVLQEGVPGNDDEGRAMAELVHQVAPGAQIYFAAGGDSEAQYEKAVSALTEAGCKVIADDITYFQSPFYQVAGGLDAVVSTAVAGGVNFFTSAGNFGQGFLEQDFDPQPVVQADGTTAQEQIFDDGTPYEDITIPANYQSRLDFQWTAPYEGVNGTGAPDALTVKESTAAGIALGPLIDVAQDGVSTTDVYTIFPVRPVVTTYRVAVSLNPGQASPAGFKMILSATGSGGTAPGGIIDDPEVGRGSGDERGQQLIPGVNTVGASNFVNSAAFGGTPTYNEFFSDQGAGTLLYDGAGHPLLTPESAGKIDFDAPDGIQTIVPGGGFMPFYGTSAAAPNAAAVAALMLQANPNLTTSQITSLLKASAIDQGQPANQQGAGLIQADRAVDFAIDALPPTLAGTMATETTTDEAPVRPFAGATLADPDTTATDTLTIALAGAGGTLTDGPGFSALRQTAGGYTLAGTGADVTAELSALVFTPTAGRPGTSSTTVFALSDVADIGRTASGGPVDVMDIDTAVAPTITGTHATTTVAVVPVPPFTGATLTDRNAGATDTLVIALRGTSGTLSGAGLAAQPDGSYALAAASPATLTEELDALSFVPAAGPAVTSSTTTFALTLASSAGPSAADGGTRVTEMSPPPVPSAADGGTRAAEMSPPPVPSAADGGTRAAEMSPPPVPSPALADKVTFDPAVTFDRRGSFKLTGTLSSPDGVSSVEITAAVDGMAQDLGAAVVNPDGTFSFADHVGAHTQALITATETDGAGGPTSDRANYSLTAGLDRGGFRARQTTSAADGSGETMVSLFQSTGQRSVDIEARGLTIDLDPFDLVSAHRVGATTFVFIPGDGLDVVHGFKLGDADHDTLKLPSSDFTSLADVLRHTGDVTGSAFITDPMTGDAIRLAGITTADLKAHPNDITLTA